MMNRRSLLAALPAVAFAPNVAFPAEIQADPLVALFNEWLETERALETEPSDNEDAHAAYYSRLDEIEAQMKVLPVLTIAGALAVMQLAIATGMSPEARASMPGERATLDWSEQFHLKARDALIALAA